MKKIFLFLFLLIGVVVSCDQRLLGAKSAVKNLVTAPYRGIRDGVLEREYTNLEETTVQERAGNLSEKKCPQFPDNTDPAVSKLMEMSAEMCESECRPWGKCNKELCSCEKLCPKGLDIFYHPPIERMSDLSAPENSLSFRNTPNENASHTMTQGFCWGHASVTSKFNRLGFFKGNGKTFPSPYNIKASDSDEKDKAIDEYKKLVDKIVNNEVVEIPGFRNLNDLSSTPELETYIYDKVAESWADRAMTFSGLSVALDSAPNSKKKNEKFFETIVRKIDNFQQPQIVFTQKGNIAVTHAVLVSHYEKDRYGKTVLCIRDNNPSQSLSDNQNCEKKMTIGANGVIDYAEWGWGDLGDIVLAHNENPESALQQQALLEHCQKNKNCQEGDYSL